MGNILNSEIIIEKCDILSVLEFYNLSPKVKGKFITSDCPSCDKKNIGKKTAFQTFTKNGRVSGKCFSCNFGASAYNIVKHIEKTAVHTTIIEKMAHIANIAVEYEIKKPNIVKRSIEVIKKAVVTAKNLYNSTNTVQVGSFCFTKLQKSGLEPDDIKSEQVKTINGVESRITINRMVTATKSGDNIVNGDDIVITYLDLFRRSSIFYKKDKQGNNVGKAIDVTRIRYQNPDLHLDRFGKPMKYASAYKSGCHIYWPEKLLQLFENAIQFDTLYIQEGELKAEKASKHGIISCGIMGIHNIVENEQLHSDFALIIKKCRIKNIVFLVDSDWNILKYKEGQKQSVNNRAYSFFSAVNRVKTYFHALVNNGIDVNVHFAYIKANEVDDKGIDDLLVNTLPGNEDKLLVEVNKLINEPIGKGEYINMHNITAISVAKLQELFNIATQEQFIEAYKDDLKQFEKFNYNGTDLRINEEGDIELAQPLAPEEKFYEKKYTTKGEIEFKWLPSKFHKRLNNLGIGQYIISEQQNTINECFVMSDLVNKTIWRISLKGLRFYILNFCLNIGDHDLYDYLVNKKEYLSDASLLVVPYVEMRVVENTASNSFIFFQNCFWNIDKDAIINKNLADLSGFVWKEQIKTFEPILLETPLVKYYKLDEYNYKPIYNENAKHAHFLQFIINTSNDNRGINFDDLLEEQKQIVYNSTINKMTSIGYLLHRHFNPALTKVITGTDTNEEVEGVSLGRTGKSLIGVFLEKMVTLFKIDGKKPDLEKDKNIYADVNENTNVIFFDDVRANFDMDLIFNVVTGGISVNRKFKDVVNIVREKTPKIYLTTNHTVRGYMKSSSVRDRVFFMPFSNWYGETWKPTDDFGTLFFDEWEHEQWNYCYQFAACCLQVYFEFGLVQGNIDIVKQKSLFNDIGETIIKWFDEYFIEGKDFDTNRLDIEIEKKDILKRFEDENKKYISQYGMTSNNFKKKLKQWCSYHFFTYNPYIAVKNKDGIIISEHGGDNKTNSKEFIKIGSNHSKKTIIDTKTDTFTEDINNLDFEVNNAILPY